MARSSKKTKRATKKRPATFPRGPHDSTILLYLHSMNGNGLATSSMRYREKIVLTAIHRETHEMWIVSLPWFDYLLPDGRYQAYTELACACSLDEMSSGDGADY